MYRMQDTMLWNCARQTSPKGRQGRRHARRAAQPANGGVVSSGYARLHFHTASVARALQRRPQPPSVRSPCNAAARTPCCTRAASPSGGGSDRVLARNGFGGRRRQAPDLAGSAMSSHDCRQDGIMCALVTRPVLDSSSAARTSVSFSRLWHVPCWTERIPHPGL